MTFMEAELMPKQLELLSELVPQARVIALLVNPSLQPINRCFSQGEVFPWYRWVHRGHNCGYSNLYLRGGGDPTFSTSAARLSGVDTLMHRRN